MNPIQGAAPASARTLSDVPAPVEGHAFICYIREDSEHADKVAALLADAGIPVWRDTENLWPGEDWRERIRQAITEGAFAFVPIFSTRSEAKGVSGQNEELYLAAEEMRRRPPGIAWMVPVRADECRVPALKLGGGRMLDDIHRADLFGAKEQRESERFVEGVRRILQAGNQPAPTAATAPDDESGDPPTPGARAHREPPRVERELKEALRDGAGDIKLYDIVVPVADAVRDELADRERYPVDGTPNVREIAEQVGCYWTALNGLLDLLVIGGAWSQEAHNRVWTEAVERVVRARSERSGNVARLAALKFPNLPIVYAGGLAAVFRNNYGFLRAIAVDTTLWEGEDELPLVARARPWEAFGDFPLVAQVIALEASSEVVDDDLLEALRTHRRGHRYTPVSDHLHDRLRPQFQSLIPDDPDYSAHFDRLEVILGLLQADLRLLYQPTEQGDPWRGPYIGNPSTGRFVWRQRHTDEHKLVERRMFTDLQVQGATWPPLAGGLFGGSVARAEAAFELFMPIAQHVRSQTF
jgi:hypothetical protein